MRGERERSAQRGGRCNKHSRAGLSVDAMRSCCYAVADPSVAMCPCAHQAQSWHSGSRVGLSRKLLCALHRRTRAHAGCLSLSLLLSHTRSLTRTQCCVHTHTVLLAVAALTPLSSLISLYPLPRMRPTGETMCRASNIERPLGRGSFIALEVLHWSGTTPSFCSTSVRVSGRHALRG